MTLLRVDGLGKHYGSTPVFANVHFSVAPGEFVAIVGDSGVGKSSLLLRFTSGEFEEASVPTIGALFFGCGLFFFSLLVEGERTRERRRASWCARKERA